MRKIAVILAAVLASGMVLTACGGKGGTSPDGTNAAGGAGEGQDIAVQVGPNPETIDPHLCTTVDANNMIIHAFEGLMTYDQEGKVVPGQAETFDVSDDGLTYTFHLRDGLKWSDGSPLTANDFVYSWKRFADPATAAPYAYDMMCMIKGYDEAANGNVDALGVSAPDDKTLVVELSVPCVYFEKILTHSSMVPVQQAAVEKGGDQWTLNPETYVGNGALKMSEWVAGSNVTMVKNENYWNASAVKLDSLKFVLMEDSNAAFSAYQTGELQMIKSIPSEEIPSLQGREDFFVAPNMGTYYVIFNIEKPPFDNSDVRMALSLAIDRDYAANVVMQGTYQPAAFFVGTGISDLEPGSSFEEVSRRNNGGKDFFDNANFEANLAKAKELLAKAGYPNGEGFPIVEYMTNDQQYHKPLAEYLQSAWKELGITVDIKIVEWSTFSASRRNGDYEIARHGWSFDYDDPSNMLNLMETDNGNNAANYSSPKVDQLLEEARVTADKEEHFNKLHEAEMEILNDAAMAPIAYYSDPYLQNTSLKGTWHSPYGYWYFMYGYLE